MSGPFTNIIQGLFEDKQSLCFVRKRMLIPLSCSVPLGIGIDVYIEETLSRIRVLKDHASNCIGPLFVYLASNMVKEKYY